MEWIRPVGQVADNYAGQIGGDTSQASWSPLAWFCVVVTALLGLSVSAICVADPAPASTPASTPASSTPPASDNFYTILDENGHMRAVQEQGSDKTKPLPTQKASDGAPAEAYNSLNGEQYIDSDYYQRREFNLSGKSRFYPMPDGMGGVQVIERVPGQDQERNFIAPAPKHRVAPIAPVTLSERYQRIPAATITDMIGMSCLSYPSLATARQLLDKPLILWPRSDAPQVKGHDALNYVLVALPQGTQDLSVQSYTEVGQAPMYYWPLPVFLNEQGCVVEGVGSYYQRRTDGALLAPPILMGTLHVPAQSRYVMLTPIEASPDLPQTTLSPVGQVRLIRLR